MMEALTDELFPSFDRIVPLARLFGAAPATNFGGTLAGTASAPTLSALNLTAPTGTLRRTRRADASDGLGVSSSTPAFFPSSPLDSTARRQSLSTTRPYLDLFATTLTEPPLFPPAVSPQQRQQPEPVDPAARNLAAVHARGEANKAARRPRVPVGPPVYPDVGQHRRDDNLLATLRAPPRPATPAAAATRQRRERDFDTTARVVVDLDSHEPAFMTMLPPAAWPPTRDPLPWDERAREMKLVFRPS
jgi:hypothetical protein